MARFQYIAMDGSGKEQKGRIEADTEQEAGNKLKQMGLFPTSIVKRGGGKAGDAGKKGGNLGVGVFAPKIGRKDLTTMTRQMATLLEAGLPLVRALRTLERQARGNIPMQKVIANLADAVEGGSTFSEALAAHPKSFNKLYVNMVRAGEASGAMETVLVRLWSSWKRRRKLREK